MNERILINFPTNFGDTIMCLPVLDAIHASYPASKITAICSTRTKDFLLRNNFLNEVVIFDKFWKARQKMRFSLSLRGKYDIMVDLKNSFLPVILGVKKRTPFYRGFAKNMHIKDAYLKIASGLIKNSQKVINSDFNLFEQEKKCWSKFNFPPSLFIACSSLSSLKCYSYENLKTVIQYLLAKNMPLIIIGENRDKSFYQDILSLKSVVDLVGKTTLNDTFYLLKNYGRLLLTVETGILHLGSYLNLPIVALFGPGDLKKAHPWSEKSIALKNTTVKCLACKWGDSKADHNCMNIEPKEVIKAIEKLW